MHSRQEFVRPAEKKTCHQRNVAITYKDDATTNARSRNRAAFHRRPCLNFNPASRVSDLKVWARSVSHTLPTGKTKNIVTQSVDYPVQLSTNKEPNGTKQAHVVPQSFIQGLREANLGPQFTEIVIKLKCHMKRADFSHSWSNIKTRAPKW